MIDEINESTVNTVKNIIQPFIVFMSFRSVLNRALSSILQRKANSSSDISGMSESETYFIPVLS